MRREGGPMGPSLNKVILFFQLRYELRETMRQFKVSIENPYRECAFQFLQFMLNKSKPMPNQLIAG
jgi:hypothetical protein